MQEVINLILLKKELQGIDKNIVTEFINKHLDSKVKQLINEKRFKNKDFKEFIKKVRADLRRNFGVFNNPKINRKKLIKNNDFFGILKSHLSSKERFEYYKTVYDKIFEKTPVSILDIGCGMNPLSIEFMSFKPSYYLALDINQKDLDIINTYFKIKKINGESRVFDASKIENYKFKIKFDYCFAFKVFEILEQTKSHRLTEDIILKIPAKKIIASFNKKTISGAPMKRSRRIWFEVMLKRLNFNFEIFEIKNEIFYIITKNLYRK